MTYHKPRYLLNKFSDITDIRAEGGIIMKKFSKLAGVTATVMAAAMVLSSTAIADETFKIGGI